MGRLVVSEFVTIDGVVEAPGGEPSHPHSGWVFDFSEPEQQRYKLDEVLAAEALLIGRTTYESFAGAWPDREGEFADRMNSMPKYVVSSTLRDPSWGNTTVLDGDVGELVGSLKDRSAGQLLVAGSPSLVRELVDLGLVDELRLMVFPVVVGGGLRLFSDHRVRTEFRPVGSRAFPGGAVVHEYEAVHA